MATVLLSLGSNLGDRQATLDAAVACLRATTGVGDVVASSYHTSTPVGGPAGQAEFLNAAARVETTLVPSRLLRELQRIERELGRTRETTWGARTLDLDLLLYDRETINEPGLVVPHRFLPFRRFVLEPACEVADLMIHPRLCWTVEDMLQHARRAPRIFEIWGGPDQLTRSVAQQIAGEVGFVMTEEELGSQVLDVVARCFRLSDSASQRSADASRKDIGGLLYKGLFFLMEGMLPDDPVDLLLGPYLVLPADDPDRAVQEAVAAIEAMQ